MNVDSLGVTPTKIMMTTTATMIPGMTVATPIVVIKTKVATKDSRRT